MDPGSWLHLFAVLVYTDSPDSPSVLGEPPLTSKSRWRLQSSMNSFTFDVYLRRLHRLCTRSGWVPEETRTRLSTFSLFWSASKAKKCRFGMKQIDYIGRQISSQGISMSQEKIELVLNFPKLTTLTSLRSLLGLTLFLFMRTPSLYFNRWLTLKGLTNLKLSGTKGQISLSMQLDNRCPAARFFTF